jgi:hypothetical protein
MHPSNRTARLTPMHPAIQAIPTFGTYLGCIRFMGVLNQIMPNRPMIPMARMSLFSPVSPAIRFVGISVEHVPEQMYERTTMDLRRRPEPGKSSHHGRLRIDAEGHRSWVRSRQYRALFAAGLPLGAGPTAVSRHQRRFIEGRHQHQMKRPPR